MTLSIITINLNNATGLLKTIESVLNQTYDDFEFIVIDGGSSDNSINYIKKFENNITYWISETDRGIYEAMNKGITRSNGEWINFMNSGDTFDNNEVLNKIFSNRIINNVDVIYGDTRYHDNWGDYILMPNDLKSIIKGLPFCHQSTFVKSRYLKQSYFNLKYKIAADFDFFYALYKSNKRFLYLPICISNYEIVNSFSRDNWPINRKETLIILGRFNSRGDKSHYYFECLVFYLKKQLKRILTDEKKLKIRNNHIIKRQNK